MTEAFQSLAGTGLPAALVAVGAVLAGIGVKVAWSGAARRDQAEAYEYLASSLIEAQQD